jgi:hypothetical protein
VPEEGIERAEPVVSTRTPVESRENESPRADVSSGSPVAIGPSETAPSTSDDALKLAIKLAVDADDYERAGTLLDVAKRLTKPTERATVVSLLDHSKKR